VFRATHYPDGGLTAPTGIAAELRVVSTATQGGAGPAFAGRMRAVAENVTGVASHTCRCLCPGKIDAAANPCLLHFGVLAQARSTDKMAPGAWVSSGSAVG
jgi:hypothetical protein